LNIENFEAIAGKGVKGQYRGQRVSFGNSRLLKDLNLTPSDEQKKLVSELQMTGQTAMYLLRGKNIEGIVSVADVIKPSSPAAINSLKSMGVKIFMLTGDNEYSARSVADELNLDGYQAECLPEDKFNKVKELQESGYKVAMAGDGINDAPAHELANVGIAMGTGTDIAMKSAEITLVRGDLKGIARARTLSYKVMRNIRQNLFFAFIYNTVGVPVAAGVLYPIFGILLSPLIAAAAMGFSSVSVIGNSLRLKQI
jgi:P-type E1-E2 ATPase